MPVILTLSVAEGEEPRIWPLLLLLPGLSSNTPTRIRSNHPSPQNVRTTRPAAPKPKEPPRKLPGGPSDNYLKTHNSQLVPVMLRLVRSFHRNAQVSSLF